MAPREACSLQRREDFARRAISHVVCEGAVEQRDEPIGAGPAEQIVNGLVVVDRAGREITGAVDAADIASEVTDPDRIVYVGATPFV